MISGLLDSIVDVRVVTLVKNMPKVHDVGTKLSKNGKKCKTLYKEYEVLKVVLNGTVTSGVA